MSFREKSSNVFNAIAARKVLMAEVAIGATIGLVGGIAVGGGLLLALPLAAVCGTTTPLAVKVEKIAKRNTEKLLGKVWPAKQLKQ